jgi:hypothetical protein
MTRRRRRSPPISVAMLDDLVGGKARRRALLALSYSADQRLGVGFAGESD